MTFGEHDINFFLILKEFFYFWRSFQIIYYMKGVHGSKTLGKWHLFPNLIIYQNYTKKLVGPCPPPAPWIGVSKRCWGTFIFCGGPSIFNKHPRWFWWWAWCRKRPSCQKAGPEVKKKKAIRGSVSWQSTELAEGGLVWVWSCPGRS